MLFADQHAQESLLSDVLPNLGRQIFAVVGNVKVMQHGAQGFGGPVQKRLLFVGEFDRTSFGQLVPIRAATKQFRVPPNGSRV